MVGKVISFKFQSRSIDLELNNKVFEPNLTTTSMLEAFKSLNLKKKNLSILDLGCGSGVIGIYIKKILKKKANVFLSDYSQHAVDLAKKNAKRNKVDVTVFKSDIFKKIDRKFDIIIDDISAIDEKIASKIWYNKFIPHNCGSSGINLTNKVIKDAPKYLNRRGNKLLLPVLSISNYKLVEKNIKKNFKNNQIILENHWPAPKELKTKFKNLLKSKKNYVFDKYGIALCFTRIYKCVL